MAAARTSGQGGRQGSRQAPGRAAAQREHYHYLAEALRGLERGLQGRLAASGRIPDDWHRIAQERGPGPKVRVALWVEADVLAFYRSQGAGHTRRMAEVLRSFMHARLAGLLNGPETLDYRQPDGGQAAEDGQAGAETPVGRRLKELRARIAARDSAAGLEPPPELQTFEERLAALRAERRARVNRKRQGQGERS